MAEALSDRDAVISAANVLMVALLKVNRVIIPAFLKWRRGVRLRMIQKADEYIRKKTQQDQDRRAMMEAKVMNGQGHGRTSSNFSRRDNSTRAGPLPSSPTSTQLIRPKVTPTGAEGDLETALLASSTINMEAGQDTDVAAGTDIIQPESSESNGTRPIREEEHTRKVQLEQLARAEQVHLLAYTSFATVIITIATIIFYATIIITLVLTLFPFSTGQALIFSFSLIATAMISESEALMQKGKQKLRDKDTRDLAKFRIKATAAHGKAPTVTHHNGEVAMTLDDIEYFSDMGE